MQESIQKIQELKDNLQTTGEILDLEQKKQKLLELEDQMAQKDFWQDQNNAKKISQQAADLKEELDEFETIEKNVNDLLELARGSKKGEEESPELLYKSSGLSSGDSESFIEKELNKLEKNFNKLEFKTMLAGEYDINNAILAIHAGTGGTDAQDWAQMLERMLLRYCKAKPARRSLGEGGKFKVNILDRQTGGEAGIKSVIFEIIGKYAYGYLQSEAGVHRLVRISPFDAEKMRHTSFALVEVLPELEEIEDTELKEEDLEINTFKSSGPGGQSVNTTDSAVRIKHKPTGITVTCQNERSQLQNKQTALKILGSKLKQYNQTEQEEEKKKLRGEFSEAAWGNQIRSYVLHPYKLVKDHRTEYETQEVEKVLDGGLDEFVENYLKYKIKSDT